MTKLIVCADDFAIHSPASAAIVQLAQAGRISATSAMSLSPLWPQHALWLRPFKDQIDVGVHLDWTSEFALAQGGCSLAELMVRTSLRFVERSFVTSMVRRQLDQFEDVWGDIPCHIDGHQHIHQFPVIRDVLLNEISQRYTGKIPYLRVSKTAFNEGGVKAKIVGAMGSEPLAKASRDRRIPTVEWLSGVYDFSGGTSQYQQRMRGWLSKAKPSTILMCHPALEGCAGDVIGSARIAEFEYLSSEGFLNDLRQFSVNVTRKNGKDPHHKGVLSSST